MTARPRPGARRVVVALVVVLVAVVGLLPTRLPVASSLGPEPAAAAKAQGSTPLADILYWAGQKAACGLTRDQLAAMMLAPIYPETGAPDGKAPSPMTLSRWDNQSTLYAFADAATPYRRAFWHPGVGMWQFDSAGGWNLTAATAISSYTAAQQAATTMASRWCVNQSRYYAWAPWFECTTVGGVCDQIYNSIFDGTSLVNVATDPAVGRDGGMETRQCTVPGIGSVTCWFIDPARAQGYAGWAYPTGPPTPVTAPFYVVSANGREYRFWLKADSGYDTTISADKAITANARTNLVWTAGAQLCDESTGRGDCVPPPPPPPGPPVAVTPWGTFRDNPIGALDHAVGGLGFVTVDGWALDPDTASPIDVRISVDGVTAATLHADQARPDIGAVIAGFGDAHGYRTTLGVTGSGPHTVCAVGVNVGPNGTVDPTLGCATVRGPADPFGSVDAVTPAGSGAIAVRGWAIDPDTTAPISVRIVVDGVVRDVVPAWLARDDLALVYPSFGPRHGFEDVLAVGAGQHQVCVTALDVGPGADGALGCDTVVVPDVSLFGAIDAAWRTPGGIALSGWALALGSTAPVKVRIQVDGVDRLDLSARLLRPSVGAVFGPEGPYHGFDAVFDAPPGPVAVCVRALDAARGLDQLLGCRAV